MPFTCVASNHKKYKTQKNEHMTMFHYNQFTHSLCSTAFLKVFIHFVLKEALLSPFSQKLICQ